MSPKSSKTDRDKIIENFREEVREGGELKRAYCFNINCEGIITQLPEATGYFLKTELGFAANRGDSCFNLIPTEYLKDFTKEISRIITTRVSGSFGLSSKAISYQLFLTPILNVSGRIDHIQILVPGEKHLHPLPQSSGISAESEQQFIYKLIKSLGNANDVKFGLSRMIKQSGFLKFDFAEAWEVGYDKHTLFKSASFSKENIAWDDEGIKAFKKGEGLPGISWEAEDVVVWDRLNYEIRFLRKIPILKNRFSTGIEDIYKLEDILELISCQVYSFYVKRKITENQLNNMFRFSPNLIAEVGLDGYLKKVKSFLYKDIWFF